MLTFLTALVVLTTIQTSAPCQLFENAFVYALIFDFAFAQPLVVMLAYLYRWLHSDPESSQLWSELHPFDGEGREV